MKTLLIDKRQHQLIKKWLSNTVPKVKIAFMTVKILKKVRLAVKIRDELCVPYEYCFISM